MAKMNTSYYFHSFWRTWWFRPIRKYLLRRWRNQGFKRFAERRTKQLTGYAPAEKNPRIKQGFVFAFIVRARRSGKIVLDKPRLTDQVVRDMVR